MLEVGILRAERDRVLEGLKKKQVKGDQLKLVDEIIEKDDRRKNIQTELDALLAQVNSIYKSESELKMKATMNFICEVI